MMVSGFRSFVVAASLTALSVGEGLPARALAAPPPGVASHDAGAWDLAFDKGNRRCRLFLRTEGAGDGFAVAMPAGCHKAFPTLTSVESWRPGSGEHVVLRDAGGTPVFDFAPDGTSSLTAVASSGDIYTLLPVNPALQDSLRAAGPSTAAVVPPGEAAEAPDAAGDGGVLVEQSAPKGKAAAAKAVLVPRSSLPPTTVATVAGNYAVLRQNRDTGCMVTLETAGRSAAELRAHLAPACRDQGIVVFDPSGWQLLHGNELVLTAKRGHTTALMRRDDKTWANAPATGAPLILKRL